MTDEQAAAKILELCRQARQWAEQKVRTTVEPRANYGLADARFEALLKKMKDEIDAAERGTITGNLSSGWFVHGRVERSARCICRVNARDTLPNCPASLHNGLGRRAEAGMEMQRARVR